MSFYTSGLKTHIIDPVHDSKNYQTEWRFKSDTAYLANLRLMNVGVTVGGILADKTYNNLVGAASVIQSIHLYDGNQLLDQILEFPTWAGFSAYNQSNQTNEDMNQVLAKNKMGFVYGGSATFGDQKPKLLTAYEGISFPTNALETLTQKAWISLKAILPMLDNSVYLPTKVFKNLRLVIQYNTNKRQVIADNTAGTGDEPSFSTCEPILVADEITDPQKQASINSQYNGVNFLSIEHDRVYVPAIGHDETKPETFVPGGFDNKTINRLLIVNTPTDVAGKPSAYWYNSLGSVAQYNQSIQVRVNGQNIFPKNGITRPNERLALLSDTWGTCNAHIGSNTVNYSNVDATGNTNGPTMDLNMVGTLDYFGCRIGQNILELQIDYTRTCKITDPGTGANGLPNDTVDDNRTLQQLYLNLFAEANKSIKVGGGRYSVLYA